MSKDAYKNDRVYLMTMTLAKRLLREGAITEKNYNDFDTKMQQKYEPKYGSFLQISASINLELMRFLREYGRERRQKNAENYTD